MMSKQFRDNTDQINALDFSEDGEFLISSRCSIIFLNKHCLLYCWLFSDFNKVTMNHLCCTMRLLENEKKSFQAKSMGHTL